jgi:3-oxoadipate enol-lactonase
VATVALHYTVDGPTEAPVLLLGASLGTTGAIWQPQLPDLLARLRVVRYDHRGHGGSPQPPGPYQVDDLGGDVLALADSLGAARFHLGGVSLGSMVALWVAQHHAARVDRLVLAGTAARPGTPESWRSRAAIVREQGTAAIAETVVGRWLPESFAADHPQVRASLLDAVRSTPAEGYAACCDALATMDLEPELAKVTAPTLVIVGSDDQSTPAELGRAVAAGIPGARLAQIDGAAHLAHLSHAEQFTRLVLDFLAS